MSVKQSFFLFILATILAIGNLRLAGQSWSSEVISDNLEFPGAATADLDNDGDIDLLTIDGESLVWYQQTASQWSRRLIDPQLPGLYGESTLDIVDLDKDGDLDFVVNVFSPPALWWYQNNNHGFSWQKHVIGTFLDVPLNRFASYGDLDGDGDIDIVSPFYGPPGTILWFEHTPVNNVWNPQYIAILDAPMWTTTADIDNDGDLDVVGASFHNGTISWFENTMSPNWLTHQIAFLPRSAYGQCADMDNDNDIDIITHSYEMEALVWIENPGWTVHVIAEKPFIIPGIVTDLNNDQLPDITFGGNGLIGWMENQGNGNAWQTHVVDSMTNGRLFPIGAHDINANNQMDIVAVAINTLTFMGDIRWYAQQGITSLENDESSVVSKTMELQQNYPNPFNPVTTIEFTVPAQGLVTLSIYNSLGQEVASPLSQNLSAGRYKFTWDAGEQASGVYYYRIEANDFVQSRKMILLK